MKLRKIFAGMAASAIALTAFAATATTTSASDTTYHAGIFFQSRSYTYRNGLSKEADFDERSTFPKNEISPTGGGQGIDTEATFTDCEINGDGEYTISLGKFSGNITEGVEDSEAESGTTTGFEWSVAEDADFIMLGISTDIPVTKAKDGDNEVMQLDGKTITVTNATITIGSQTFNAEVLPPKTDNKYLTLSIVNAYDDPETNVLGSYTMPGKDVGMTVTFTINGLSADADSSSSSEAASSSSAAASSSKAASSTASKNSSKTTSTATSTSDKSAESGAAAGIALAGIALAGAAIVVAKKK